MKVVLKDVPERGPEGRSLRITSRGRVPIACCFLTDPNAGVFLFVKYYLIRVSELLEKPYVLSLLISRGGGGTANQMPLTCQCRGGSRGRVQGVRTPP